MPVRVAEPGDGVRDLQRAGALPRLPGALPPAADPHPPAVPRERRLGHGARRIERVDAGDEEQVGHAAGDSRPTRAPQPERFLSRRQGGHRTPRYAAFAGPRAVRFHAADCVPRMNRQKPTARATFIATK